MNQIDKDSVFQFIKYFLVGGTAALVEWASFAVFDFALGINYLVSTALAFVFSTFANWILGRRFVFREESRYKPVLKDIVDVYIVSAAGLLFNLVLMFVFVKVILIPEMISKVIATGLVFVWNFVIRKFVIYSVNRK